MSSFNDSSELLDDNTNYCTPIVETVDNDMFAFQERPEKKPPRDYKALDDCIDHAYESECHSIEKLRAQDRPAAAIWTAPRPGNNRLVSGCDRWSC